MLTIILLFYKQFEVVAGYRLQVATCNLKLATLNIKIVRLLIRAIFR